MTDRRSTYFAFQGLFMAVLLLLFVYQYRDSSYWGPRLAFLIAAMGASLSYLRLCSAQTLSRWWFQAGLFLADAGLASLILHWRQPGSQVYLIYFLIIFGTALTRNFKQSALVGVVTCGLYLFVSWSPGRGLPPHSEFWLRFLLLIITTALFAVLALDAQQSQVEQDRRYRERLIQVERLATLGQVAGEVAHRIKGPLTTILVNAEVLSHRHGKSKGILKELGEIRDEVGRCKEILKHLLDLGRIEEMDMAPHDLRQPIRQALKAVETRSRRLGLKQAVSGLEAPLPVLGDSSLLQEAIAAVLENAVEASHEGGRISLGVRPFPDGRGGWLDSAPSQWVLCVEDDGKGIAEADLEEVFRPFFTTKKDGSGLGLSAALRILQKHGGSIEAESEGPGRGARFILTIPRAV